MHSQQQNALQFRDVYFNYKSKLDNFTLTGINLSVPKGGIYGLLGSSGCGKTTLLRCALGRLAPQSGSILLFGKPPGCDDCYVPGPGVGYMPQELALYINFTIEETLKYFGRLFGMSSLIVETKIKFFVKFLQLPNKGTLICNLSGGQQRRVSLASALFHSPPLLILDEPTVGVDPLLREAIWLHLESLCKTGLTVILTTHYIDEARSARVVGFMRSGKILTEGTPTDLMSIHESVSLEAIFLKLCRDDDSNQITDNSLYNNHSIPKIEINGECVNKNSISKSNHNLGINLKTIKNVNNNRNGKTNYGYSGSTFSLELVTSSTKDTNATNGCTPADEEIIFKKTSSMSRMSALIHKNFKQLSRNLLLLLFFVLLPSVEIILVVICIGQNIKYIPVAVYNPETSSNWSEVFLNSLDSQHISIVRYQELEPALESVRINDAWAAITFDKDFTDALKMRQILTSDADEELINQSSIRITIDMSNQVIGLQIQRQIFEAFMRFVETLAIANGVNPEALKPPIIIEPPVYGEPKPSLTTFIAPGALIVVAYFATTVVTCHLLIRESHDKLVDRSLVAGVTAFEFVLSHVILQLIMLAIQVALKLIIAFVIFSIPNHGSMVLSSALTFMQGICGLMFGLMISAACPDEIYATTLGIGTFFPSVILGGIFWPVESMPMWLRYISYTLPSTLPIESLRCILLRGWGLNYYQVLIGFIVTFLWFIFFLVNSILFFAHKL